MISGHPSSEHRADSADSKEAKSDVRITATHERHFFLEFWITKQGRIITTESTNDATTHSRVRYWDSVTGKLISCKRIPQDQAPGEEQFLQSAFTKLANREFKDEIDWKAMGMSAAVKELICAAARNKTFFYQEDFKENPDLDSIEGFFNDPSRGCILDPDHCLMVQHKQVIEFEAKSKRLIETPQKDGMLYLRDAHLIQMGDELFLIQAFNESENNFPLFKLDREEKKFEFDQTFTLDEKKGDGWLPEAAFSASPDEIIFICNSDQQHCKGNRIVKYNVKKQEVTGVLDYLCTDLLTEYNRILAQRDGIFLLASDIRYINTEDQRFKKLYLLDTVRMSLHEIPLEPDFFPIGILADQRLVIGSPTSIQIIQNPQLIENYQKQDASQLLSDKIDESLASELIPGIRSIIKSYTDGYTHTLAQSPCRFQFMKQEQVSRNLVRRGEQGPGDAKSPSP